MLAALSINGIIDPVFGVDMVMADGPGGRDVTCSWGNDKKENLARMVCRGGSSAVIFNAENLAPAARFSGTWNDRRMQNHRYSMDQSKAACSASLQYLIDGVVVAQSPPLQFDPALRARLQRDSTLGEVVRVLGPGHIFWGSGLGNIIWKFTDGQMISTTGYPQTLTDPVTIDLNKQ